MRVCLMVKGRGSRYMSEHRCMFVHTSAFLPRFLAPPFSNIPSLITKLLRPFTRQSFPSILSEALPNSLSRPLPLSSLSDLVPSHFTSSHLTPPYPAPTPPLMPFLFHPRSAGPPSLLDPQEGCAEFTVVEDSSNGKVFSPILFREIERWENGGKVGDKRRDG